MGEINGISAGTVTGSPEGGGRGGRNLLLGGVMASMALSMLVNSGSEAGSAASERGTVLL